MAIAASSTVRLPRFRGGAVAVLVVEAAAAFLVEDFFAVTFLETPLFFFTAVFVTAFFAVAFFLAIFFVVVFFLATSFFAVVFLLAGFLLAGFLRVAAFLAVAFLRVVFLAAPVFLEDACRVVFFATRADPVRGSQSGYWSLPIY
jgi:hypothetical protein